jgi:hypothetical protein
MYKVVRFYLNRPGYHHTILDRVTLEQAQRHCESPETSFSKCKLPINKARTRRMGPWFDAYEEL